MSLQKLSPIRIHQGAAGETAQIRYLIVDTRLPSVHSSHMKMTIKRRTRIIPYAAEQRRLPGKAGLNGQKPVLGDPAYVAELLILIQPIRQTDLLLIIQVHRSAVDGKRQGGQGASRCIFIDVHSRIALYHQSRLAIEPSMIQGNDTVLSKNIFSRTSQG